MLVRELCVRTAGGGAVVRTDAARVHGRSTGASASRRVRCGRAAGPQTLRTLPLQCDIMRIDTYRRFEYSFQFCRSFHLIRNGSLGQALDGPVQMDGVGGFKLCPGNVEARGRSGSQRKCKCVLRLTSCSAEVRPSVGGCCR